MTYCTKCGSILDIKHLDGEGEVPYCNNCKEYRFETFNVAVIMAVYNTLARKVLLVKQYGKDRYILVAGYVKKGEAAEETCRRELLEETHLIAKNLKILETSYYFKTNTLMLFFAVEVDSLEVLPNAEVDEYAWFGYEEALANLKPDSLAFKFYANFVAEYLV